MIRKLLVSGNKANLVCIPKEFVERNGIKSKQDLYVSDLGRSIIFNVDPPKDKTNKEIYLGKSSLDEILLKLKAIYYSGSNDIEIILPEDIASRDIVEKEITLLWGIKYIKKNNRIMIYSENHYNDCNQILKKCFEDTLYIATHLTKFSDSDKWFEILDAGYKKTIARIDFVLRLLNNNSYKCIRSVLKNHSIALILQFIVKALYRIAQRLKESNHNCSVDIIKELLSNAYSVCFNKSVIDDLLKLLSLKHTCEGDNSCWLCSEIDNISSKCKKIMLKMIEI